MASKRRVKSDPAITNDKLEALQPAREDGAGELLTTNHGTRINDNQNSLEAGTRGPSLLEDFILREKITHFDHERIPERVVHARGAAAHGHFQVYKSLARLTKPPLNRSMPADGNPKDFEPRRPKKSLEASAALSMANTVKDTAKSRRVAILAADGVEGAAVEAMKRALTEVGATPKVVAPRGGTLTTARGAKIPVDFSLLTVGSVLFDAVFIPGGVDSAKALAEEAVAVLFVNEAYKHCTALAVTGAGFALLPTSNGGNAAAKGADGKTDHSGGRRPSWGAMAPSARWVRSSSRRSRDTALGAGNPRASAFPCS